MKNEIKLLIIILIVISLVAVSAVIFYVNKNTKKKSDLNFEIASNSPVSSADFGYISDYEETKDFVEYYGISKPTVNGQDYWAAAVKYCKNLELDGNQWRMPTEKEMSEIAKKIYNSDNCVRTNKKGNSLFVKCNKNKVINSELWKIFQRNSKQKGFSLWIYSQPTEEKAKVWDFTPDFSYTYYEYRNQQSIKTICVRDLK